MQFLEEGTGKLENGESFDKPGAEAVLGQAVGGEWVGSVLFFMKGDIAFKEY